MEVDVQLNASAALSPVTIGYEDVWVLWRKVSYTYRQSNNDERAIRGDPNVKFLKFLQ
jgi:hypothetical protein